MSRKKRLPTPSEEIFPEILDRKKQIPGQQTIKSLCPSCESNDRFRILEILVHPSSSSAKRAGAIEPPDEDLLDPNMRVRLAKGTGSAGRYRCECTVCGFKQTFTSKHPKTGSYGN
jgi:hypothetical protein